MKKICFLILSVWAFFVFSACAKTENHVHTYDGWANQDDIHHQRLCTVCGEAEQRPHSWNEGEVIKTASCSDEGQIQYTCSECGGGKTEKTPKLPHDFSYKEESIAFLKSKENYDSGAVYYYACANCLEKGTETFTVDNKIEWVSQEFLYDKGLALDFDGETVVLYYTFGDSRFLIYTSPDGELTPGNYTGSYRGCDVRFRYDGTSFTFNYDDVREAI